MTSISPPDDFTPDGWSSAEIFEETTQIEGVAVHLVGMVSRDEDGTEVTGSAAALDAPPRGRARFELLERISVADAIARPLAEYEVFDQRGRTAGAISGRDLVPRSPEPDRWQYARSNGIALHVDRREASRRATWELFERDHVLRSWYGHTAPKRLDATPLPSALDAAYSVETYELGTAHSRMGECRTAGVFAFPARAGVPLVYGFGARDTIEDAIAAAARECVQRLGFLWGEEIPEEEPAFAPTPSYHQELFLWPRSADKLRRWLDGGNDEIPIHASTSEGATRFVDLTPRSLAGELSVVRALPSGQIPLTFGTANPALRGQPPPERVLHPIA